jgi:hypothetical protein
MGVGHGCVTVMSRGGRVGHDTMSLIGGRPAFASLHDARQAIFEYIPVVYNRQRLHSTLG